MFLDRRPPLRERYDWLLVPLAIGAALAVILFEAWAWGWLR